MTSNRLKRLAKLRLILSVIAVFLAGLMIVSGVMLFKQSPSAEESMEPSVETFDPTTSETTEIAEAESTTVSTEEAMPSTENPADETLDRESLLPDQVVEKRKSTSNNHPDSPKHTDNSDHSSGSSDASKPIGHADSDSTSSPGDSGSSGDSVNSTELSYSTLNVIAGIVSESSAVTAEEAGTLSDTTPSNSDTITNPLPTGKEENNSSLWGILFWTSSALLAADIIAILFISQQIEKEFAKLQRLENSVAKTNKHALHSHPGFAKATTPATNTAAPGKPKRTIAITQKLSATPQIGTIHQVGRRDYQQDSLGHASVLHNQGTLAVLADGMGGLSGGEKLSQKIIMDALAMGHQLMPGQVNGVLWKMVDKINENANQMLGPDGLYKSGSTFVAVLAYKGHFQWISVGDSRVYLYRQGYSNQLNHDHDQLQVWMADVLSGRRTMEEVLNNPDGRKLTSFIGMGQLKYIDGSRSPIPLEPNDRLVLMSDGIYNILSEEQLADVLKRYPDVDQAAAVIDRIIRDSNHPHQDNYTAIVLGF